MFSRRLLSKALTLAALVGVAAAPQLVSAQAYPAKPVTLVVSYPAGGDTDAVARLLAERLGARFGQQFVVDNKPGASGTIGNAFVAKAAPDGYTLLATPSTISTALLVLKPGSGAAYDTVGDFTPIIQVGTQPLYWLVNTSTGIKNIADLLAAIKSGKINSYGSPGSGSPMHLQGEMFNKATGSKLQQIPYRGTGPVVTDMLGGTINLAASTLGPFNQHITSGKVTAIAITDTRRSSLSPNVATLQEQGVKDADIAAWIGIMGPKGMNPAVVSTLNGAINDIMKSPDVVERLKNIATLVVGGDASVLARQHAGDHAKYGKVIQDLKIQAD